MKRQKDRNTYTKVYRQMSFIDRQTDRFTDRQRGIQTDLQMDGQLFLKTDEQTYRQVFQQGINFLNNGSAK